MKTRNNKLLVSNRGEIAVRIFRAAAELGFCTAAVFPEDDARSLHVRRADTAYCLEGKGTRAYLDIEQILAVAKENGCGMIHPGYGFLSENADFARRCEAEGITFVGPRSETLALFGDKARARALAETCGVPVITGTSDPVTLAEAADFLSSLGSGAAIMIKAVSGGGGRGMRPVNHLDELKEAYTRCRSEAQQAFGNDEVYVEQLITPARHIEVQVIGDGSGAVTHLWERECSIQRRHQNLIEMAPCPALPSELRDRITGDAVRLAKKVQYRNAGTFEFLVDSTKMDAHNHYAFMEANARLQVEHTVTEEVTGLDLVKIQLQLAMGSSLSDLGLLQEDIPQPRGFAVQVRINTETMDTQGNTRPSGGTLSAFEAPSGRGIRTDTYGYAGYRTNPNFDSLLAKLVCHATSSDIADAMAKTYRGLCEFRIEGVRTNIPFLQGILQHPDFIANRIHTRFVDDHMDVLAEIDTTAHPKLFFDQEKERTRAGARMDDTDPLAVLDYGKSSETEPVEQTEAFHIEDTMADFDMMDLADAIVMRSQMQGTIVSIDIREGDRVGKGRQIMVMESMKMEHVIQAEVDGLIVKVEVATGDTVYEGHPLVVIEPGEADASEKDEIEAFDLDELRDDLAEAYKRHEITLDAARPEAVAKRRAREQRTARENIEDLCDPGTFVEYGSLAIAAQRRRRSLEDLIQNTPADGFVAGLGQVNGEHFDEEKAHCAIMSYDYMVLAGTQGIMNHKKHDRMFELTERLRTPLVIFTEGGGGRPGDTDAAAVAAMDVMTFHLFGKLSGLVPLVGINSGRCFAGNAALLGCCDVVIAAENSNIGMGGPAMIEGGGLGVFRPEDIGPIKVQVPNGVVDIAVKDEAEAVRAAKQYLSYFQGPIEQWECADQRMLRRIVPENRLRIYKVRSVIETMADTGSILELRPHYG
ncbi:MAG: carbamoyl-phosphate synthase large subunit, partial [Deltaproteobacteria bacterium]|nr:carbamoyl-phosphate synthase large subunit [Deltaproteobacteria bacterium]